MSPDARRLDLSGELRALLDDAHDRALGALHEADERAELARRSARAQSERAAAALETAASELGALAAALREEPEAAPEHSAGPHPLAALEGERPAPARRPDPAPAPSTRPRATSRASLRDSPLASLLQDTTAGAEPAPAPPLEESRPEDPAPGPVEPPEPSGPLTVRARPGLVETWRRRTGLAPD